MRNPQGHYSFDAYLYRALQTIAGAYGLSASDYVSRLLTPVVKAEMVNLEIPLNAIYSPTELQDFTVRELSKRYIKTFHPSSFMRESQEAFLAFQNYVAAQSGYTVPVPHPNIQVPKEREAWIPPKQYLQPVQQEVAVNSTPEVVAPTVSQPIGVQPTQRVQEFPQVTQPVEDAVKSVKPEPIAPLPIEPVVAPQPTSTPTPTEPEVSKNKVSRKSKFGSF